MGRVGDVKKKSWRKILQDNYMDIIQEIDVIDVILIYNNIHIKPKYRRRKIWTLWEINLVVNWFAAWSTLFAEQNITKTLPFDIGYPVGMV
jgi:hypothetical protein